MAYAPAPPPLATAWMTTPIGTVVITAGAGILTSIEILTERRRATAPTSHPVLMEAARQLSAYFAGALRNFNLPLASLDSARGMALRTGIAAIPYGSTLTYGMLAKLVDSAPRAVGQACRRNPFPIIIPCHRVTSSAGTEYYSGGEGARTKAWLIHFEAANLPLEQRDRLL